MTSATAPGLRIGDADREAAAASLREHYAAGRLTIEEFQHRLDAVFGARTAQELAAITRDLPYVPASCPAFDGAFDRTGAPGTAAPQAGFRPGRAGATSRGHGAFGASGTGQQGDRDYREQGRRRPGSAGRLVRGLAGLVVVILAILVVAALLPVALFGMAISRSALFVLAMLLLGRRGPLRRLRIWLLRVLRRRPF